VTLATEELAATPGMAEHKRRRTFAIISHPDAGKTTLTEAILLASGAIHLAGEVRARGERRRTRSDWMKIEQARGISVTTSVMTFAREGLVFNLLDTPGHEDFSEDTYRTLTAVDSAIMVLDAARGIQSQTRKLFEVCRLRDMPIITFINKIDREALDPFALLDEIHDTLALDTTPVTWPVGMGGLFHGIYDLHANTLVKPDAAGDAAPPLEFSGPDDPALAARLPVERHAALVDESMLAREASSPFDLKAYHEGHLTPVIFGSALKHFGVPALVSAIARWAPSPRPQPAEPAAVSPDNDKVSGFVFKVQANMDKNHRDRVAFMRLCSGRFRRGMKLRQERTQRQLAVQNPIFFFARDRDLAEGASPGDIIGIPNHGTISVGDTFSEMETLRFTGLPNFAPEILRRVRVRDAMRTKHLRKALADLAEEGVTQVFRPRLGGDWIVGVVGPLQLDVLSTRMESEYGIEVILEAAPYDTARWVEGPEEEMVRFVADNRGALADDRDGRPVFMARNSWDLERMIQDWPKLSFHATRERA